MTNDEIRIKIAELKGWSYLTPVVGTFKKDTIAISGKGPDGYRHINIPSWPTDPAAALELVEEHMGFRGIELLDNGNYRCWHQLTPGAIAIYHDADTFCRAVCLAYIAWKEQGK